MNKITMIILDTKNYDIIRFVFPKNVGYIFYKEIYTFNIGKYRIEFNWVSNYKNT